MASTTENHELEPYFGKVEPQYERMLAEDKLSRETDTLPAAYLGKNKHLTKILDYMITNENEFYTSRLLPYIQTDDINIQWEIFKFDKTLMDLEPHMGVPRYVTAEREARTDRLVRRGLGFIIEHGFYKTDVGRQHYLMNLRQIVDSVSETAYHGVIHALLTADNHYRVWNAQHGPKVSRPQYFHSQERRRWGAIQKQERGLYLIDAEVKDQMRSNGVVPDTWVLPHKMGIYATMVPNAETEYYRKGAGAAANLERGPENLTTFRGSQVYECRPFDIDFIGAPRDLLSRQRQCGEWFFLKEDETKKIYSMDADDFVEISYAKAKEAADQFTESGDSEGILVFRPFQTYNMSSAILMKSGLETGFTAHGHHDFMLTDDVIHKCHIGHYTMYHKSIVKQPKNVHIVEDVFATGYVGGEGAEFFTPAELEQQAQEEQFSKDLIALHVKKDINNQNIPIDLLGDYSSLLEGDQVSVSKEKLFDQICTLKPEGQKALRSIRMSKPVESKDGEKFLTVLRSLNTLCWRGMTLKNEGGKLSADKKTTTDGKWVVEHVNSGHWGPNVYPGVRSVRMGENTFIKDMGYEKVKMGLCK